MAVLKCDVMTESEKGRLQEIDLYRAFHLINDAVIRKHTTIRNWTEKGVKAIFVVSLLW